MIKQLSKVRISTGVVAALLLLLLLVSGCSTRQENLSLLSPDDMYARATAAMEERRHEQAINLLELFVNQNLGDPRAPDARMMLGEAHMARREYPTAATHFQRMIDDFPLHPRALEARFQICEAYYRLSPPPQRDQQFTIAALLHCESVADNFPGTTEAQQARIHADELRHKLAQKVFDAGKHYFRRGWYDGAIIYFEDVVNQYPSTSLAPSALEQLIETYARLGYVEQAEEAREQLLREYPDSPEALSALR